MAWATGDYGGTLKMLDSFLIEIETPIQTLVSDFEHWSIIRLLPCDENEQVY